MVPTFFPGYKNPKVITFKSIYSFWKHYMRGFLATLKDVPLHDDKKYSFYSVGFIYQTPQHKKGDWFKTVNSDSKRLSLLPCFHYCLLPFYRLKVDNESWYTIASFFATSKRTGHFPRAFYSPLVRHEVKWKTEPFKHRRGPCAWWCADIHPAV